MIISHRHRFIFIKTAKTAGTSIEQFLSPLCGPADVITPIWPAEDGHTPRNYRGRFNPLPELWEGLLSQTGDNPIKPGKGLTQAVKGHRFTEHLGARHVRPRVGAAVWRDYFTFAVERNPWDKTVSHYFWERKRGLVRDLDDYFARGKLPTNWVLYADRHNRIMVDRVLLFESLDSGLAEVCAHLSLPFPGTLTARAKGGARAERASYRDVLSPAQRQRVAAAFHREIAAFGYEW